jgi:hypothetical protein
MESRYIDKYGKGEKPDRKALFALSGVFLLGCVIFAFSLITKATRLDNEQYHIRMDFSKKWELIDGLSTPGTSLLAYAELEKGTSIAVSANPLQEGDLLFSQATDSDLQKYIGQLCENEPSTIQGSYIVSGKITGFIVVINGKRFTQITFPANAAGSADESTLVIWDGNYNNTHYQITAAYPSLAFDRLNSIEKVISTLSIGD